ncbi:MAG: motility associated factor glycosyltransferase family protein [Ignavibacteriaceae bacterium]
MEYTNLQINKILLLRAKTYLKISKYFFRYTLSSLHDLNRTKRLQGIHNNDSAFVFANGPSIKLLDPGKITLYKNAGYSVFGINSYISTEFGAKVIPDYYVLSDPGHFGRPQFEISEKRKRALIEEVDKIIKLNIPLFVPSSLFRRIKYKNIFPFNDSENIFSNNAVNILHPRGYVSMTAYKALAAACYLGFRKIYICGFDNNYFKNLEVDQENNIFYPDDHFYPQEDVSTKRKVHPIEGRTLSEFLFNQLLLFNHLEKFKGYPIINLDKFGLVDTFSKKHDLDIYL